MSPDRFTLSVVIPCYNEKNSIHTIVEKVLAAPIKDKEIIVVDDKSTDGTSDILDNEIAPLVSKVIHHEVNGRRAAHGLQAGHGRRRDHTGRRFGVRSERISAGGHAHR